MSLSAFIRRPSRGNHQRIRGLRQNLDAAWRGDERGGAAGPRRRNTDGSRHRHGHGPDRRGTVEKSQRFGHGADDGGLRALHADNRIQHGFAIGAVLAEFRALRATVLRLYEESGGTDLSEVRRFNEAVDETLTESMKRFAVQTDVFRDQFIGILSHDLRTPLGGHHDGRGASGYARGQSGATEPGGVTASCTARSGWSG